MSIKGLGALLKRLKFNGTEILGSVKHYHNGEFQSDILPPALYYELTDNGDEKYYTVKGEGSSHHLPRELTIPATYNDIEVRIGELGGQDHLVSVTYTGEVCRVLDSAFIGCTLWEAQLGSSVYLGNYAFVGNWLRKLDSTILALGEGTFSGCPYLEELSISNKVTSIPKDCFLECTSLRKIYFSGDEGDWEWLMYDRGEGNDVLDNVEVVFCPHLYFTEWETLTEPSCSEPGEERRYCTACKFEQYQAIPATGNHQWGAWTLTLEPTCTEEGKKECKCTVCNTINPETQTVPAKGHTEVAATCIKPRHCSTCDYVFDSTLAPHTWGEWVLGKDGKEHAECSVCHAPGERGIEFVYTYLKESDSYSVKAGRDLEGEIVIPSTYNGKAVTDIWEKGFADQTGITSITIPSSIKTMGYAPFARCNFEHVYITDVEAWLKLTPFANSNLPTNCTEHTHILDKNGVEITDLVLPDGLTTIPGYRFLNATNIKTVTIPASVKEIEAHAFLRSGLTTIYYGGTEEEWNAEDFIREYWYSVPEHTVYYYSEEEPTDDGNYWHWVDGKPKLWSPYIQYFNYVEQADGTYSVTLKPDIDIPNEIEIPSAYNGMPVIAIYPQAFEGCSTLTSIEIPNSIITICPRAFMGCSSLTRIVIPDSVINIGSNAFSDCSGLTDIIIGSSVTSIDAVAFSNCSSLTSVTIPDSVTYMERQVFSGCSSLTSVVIGSGVTSIGEMTFHKCPSLTSVVIPDSVTSIDKRAFFSCDSLTDVEIPNSIIEIGEAAFYGCKSLESIVIPNGVTSIGDWVFGWCTNLTSVVIPDSVTSIGYAAFYYCSNLTIHLSEGNTCYRIEKGCLVDQEGNIIFANATAYIPDSVSAIGRYSFGGYYAAPIKIPLSVKTIEPQAFTECYGLEVYIEAESLPEGWAPDWHDGSVIIREWGNIDVDLTTYLVTGSGEYLTDEEGNKLII